MVDSIAARLAAAGLPPLPRSAWLELDLDALAGNLHELRAQAGGAGIPVFPVVKADAYGHGAVPIAKATVHSTWPWTANTTSAPRLLAKFTTLASALAAS